MTESRLRSQLLDVTKTLQSQTDDVLFTERTSAMLDEPAIHTSAVKFMDTRQHTNPLFDREFFEANSAGVRSSVAAW